MRVCVWSVRTNSETCKNTSYKILIMFDWNLCYKQILIDFYLNLLKILSEIYTQINLPHIKI